MTTFLMILKIIRKKDEKNDYHGDDEILIETDQ